LLALINHQSSVTRDTHILPVTVNRDTGILPVTVTSHRHDACTTYQ